MPLDSALQEILGLIADKEKITPQEAAQQITQQILTSPPAPSKTVGSSVGPNPASNFSWGPLTGYDPYYGTQNLQNEFSEYQYGMGEPFFSMLPTEDQMQFNNPFVGTGGGNFASNPNFDYDAVEPLDQGGEGGDGFWMPPSSGGGGGQKKITWEEFDLGTGGPEWWKAMKPSQWTPETEYIALANIMLPHMSPEDQRNVSANIFQMVPEYFGHLDPEMLDIPAPSEPLSSSMRQRFQSARRGGQSLNTLEAMLGATGREREKFGPGYNYLRTLADTIQDFGGGGGLPTRTQRTQFRGALDPLLAQSQSGPLGAYSGIARALTQPFFSAGILDPITKNRSGQSWFGRANPQWF